MANNNWKNLERKIAKEIGGTRVLQKGISAPDIVKGDLIIEAKRRKTFSLHKTLEQNEQYRTNKNKIMSIIRRKPGKNNLEVYLKYTDLKKLIKSSLRVKDFVVQLSYKDFVEMAKDIPESDDES